MQKYVQEYAYTLQIPPAPTLTRGSAYSYLKTYTVKQ